MILTLGKNDEIVLTELGPKEGKEEEIKKLEELYSTPDFERGYLRHGIRLYDSDRNGRNVHPKPGEILCPLEEVGISQRYPFEVFSTTAKNTLIVIRSILKGQYGRDIDLVDFFNKERNEIDLECNYVFDRYNMNIEKEKLRYLLKNEELAIPLLKDINLDFYLFSELLTKVKIVSENRVSENFRSVLYNKAKDNTDILVLAKSFSNLNKKNN